MNKSRRHFMALGAGGIAAAPFVSLAKTGLEASGHSQQDCHVKVTGWARGIEGQRKADLGNGYFLNPVLAGDYPDPTILKNGDDYYMTHSSFDATPGLLIWHSRDLVNWQPVGPALAKPLGIVFAPELVKHGDRYYIYIPFMKAPWSDKLDHGANIFVIHAPSMHGPWSDPVDLGVYGLIDPGHAVGEDGRRYLFLSGVNRVRLSDDGLSVNGTIEKVYDGWRYPDEWVTEAYALEGPKLLRRGDWFYMVTAVGGTSGPSTGHMVIVARSRSIHGPWENCPHNPIVRTEDADEYWWSRGHATIVEGPDGNWHMVYHGYENGYRSLGRQTLLEPIEWTSDGWPVAMGGDLSRALPKPSSGESVSHGLARSDDFSKPAFGTRWTFFGASPDEAMRATFQSDGLLLSGKGSDPGNCSPLVQTIGDQAYEVTVTMELAGEALGGLLLYFNDRLFIGVGHDGQKMRTYRGGNEVIHWREPAPETRKLHLRIRNEHHIVTFYYSIDGKDWIRHGLRSETSGYNANTVDDLQGLRPALFAAGSGGVMFRNYTYRAL